jgi:hypothetical protein
MGWQIGLAVGGAILGKIGADRQRREIRAQRRREKKVALRTQESLIGSVSGIRNEYMQRAGMARAGFGLSQAAAIQGYTQERSQMDSMIGSSNLAYAGGLQEQSNLLNQSFTNTMQSNTLQAQQNMFNINQGFESELRDVQVGLLNLERNAANRGYSIPSIGATFNATGSVGGIV